MFRNRRCLRLPVSGAARRAVCALLLSALGPAAPAEDAASSRLGWCGTSEHGGRDGVWASRERLQRRGALRAAARSASFDAGQIAVLVDQGDLAFVKSALDLQGLAIRFTPEAGGYRVEHVAAAVAGDPGTPLALQDDDSRAVALPFAFPMGGESYATLYVNSDGNVTLGSGDRGAAPRTLGRLVSGPPRVAALFTDLDPSAGGAVTTAGDRDRFIVTWRDVPQFGKGDRNTFQLVLHRGGRIELVYSNDLNAEIEEGVAGIAPGYGRGGLSALDLSTASGAVLSGAVAESFRTSDRLDIAAAARRFYETHRDDYQQLVFFTSRPLTAPTAFAYSLTVRNTDAGIGAPVSDHTGGYGSQGRLESLVMMDAVAKYPDDLEKRFLRADSTLAVLAHEVGHRWLAYARFRDAAGPSDELLGRGKAHWSFFADTQGSHNEGNAIEELSHGRYRTTDAGVRYSPLDQYLMGIRPAAEVPPFFFVRSPVGAGDDPGRLPEVGVRFEGTRQDVTIEDVIAALGPRQPLAGPKPPFRQAYVYVSVGAPNAVELAKVDRIRTAFEAYFANATEGRWAVSTSLD
jgi:hypothetical protein